MFNLIFKRILIGVRQQFGRKSVRNSLKELLDHKPLKILKYFQRIRVILKTLIAFNKVALRELPQMTWVDLLACH